MWNEEEIRFVTEYYKDYSILEIADELRKPVKIVKKKIKDLGLISNNQKRCKDCNKIKNISEFYKRKKDGNYNSYCKECDNIRRRNNTIMKRIKSDLDRDLNKIEKNNQIKRATKNEIFECTMCKKQKVGKEFYYDSNQFKRISICIECYKQYRKELAVKKIEEEMEKKNDRSK